MSSKYSSSTNFLMLRDIATNPSLTFFYEPAIPSPTRWPLVGCPLAYAGPPGPLIVAAPPVPVRSLIRRPSIKPLKPRFCRPMTLLSSPFQMNRSPSLPPTSDPHSDPLRLVDAEISPLCARPDRTLVLMLRPPAAAARSDEKDSFAVVPPREKSEVEVGDPIGSRLPTKKLGLRDPSMPRPPPAAMAVALNTAAAFLLSSRA